MAADIHLHSTRVVGGKRRRAQLFELSADALDDITESDIRCFKSHSLGSRFFNLRGGCGTSMCIHWQRIMESDSVGLGEVSYLKAAIFDDESYVPTGLTLIDTLIGEELPLLDVDMAVEIIVTLRRGSEGRESLYPTIAHDDHKLREFINRNIGSRLFLVAW